MRPGMKIDLGALAKGYSADCIATFLKSQGVTDALIDLGGNILTVGQHPIKQQPWRIGIQNPVEKRGQHLLVLSVKDKSVVTSGIYERHLEVDGQSFHHIFDSKTGYPVETDLASITIISDRSVDGEIWTTRLFGEAPASILNTVESLPGIRHLIGFAIRQDCLYQVGFKLIYNSRYQKGIFHDKTYCDRWNKLKTFYKP